MEGIVEKLRVSELFEVARHITALEPVRFLVVHSRNGEPYWAWATCSRVLGSAKVAILDARLELVLHSITWPESVLDSSRLLPDSWATFQLVASRKKQEKLSHVPSWGHEDRGARVVFFQKTLADLDHGELEDWIRHLEVYLQDGQTSPYR
jgi:hypothetical protein